MFLSPATPALPSCPGGKSGCHLLCNIFSPGLEDTSQSWWGRRWGLAVAASRPVWLGLAHSDDPLGASRGQLSFGGPGFAGPAMSGAPVSLPGKDATLDCQRPEPKETHHFSPCRRRCAVPCAGVGGPTSPPHHRVEEVALQSAATLWLGANCCGATFSTPLSSPAALGAAALALDYSSCSGLASWCREGGAGGLTAPRTGRGWGKDGTQRAQWTQRVVEGSGGDATPQLVPAQLGKGVQGTIPVDHCPHLNLEGDFQAGTSPDAVPQGCEEETAIGLRAEKAVLTTVGFYTNKKKYHRQAGLCAASGAALMGRVQAPSSSAVAVACAGVTGVGERSGSCSAHPNRGWALVLLLWGRGCQELETCRFLPSPGPGLFLLVLVRP